VKLAAMITFVVIGLYVWGGFFALLARAIRKEGEKERSGS